MDRAAAFLQTVISNDPPNAEAHVLMGSTQLLRNAPDQASKSFSAAIERQPKKTIGYRALADLQIRQGQPDDACKVIRAGLQAQPDSLALRLVLAGFDTGRISGAAGIEMRRRDTSKLAIAPGRWV